MDEDEFLINYLNVKIGDELSGNIVANIYSQSDYFIVYSSIERKGIACEFTGGDDKFLNPIFPLITEINGLLNRLREPDVFNGMISTAYTQCILGHAENGIEILIKVRGLIDKKIIAHQKINYLFFSIVIIIFNTLLSLILYYSSFLQNFAVFEEYYLVATFGSYGGFMSIMNKMNKLNFKGEDDNRLLFYMAFSRALLSMLSAIIVYILLRSNLILGVLEIESNVYIFYIFSIMAGFSESFVPDLLTNIQTKTTEKM